MLKESCAAEIINSGLRFGADFVDVFVEKNQEERYALLNSAIDSSEGGIDFGIGIRLLYGGNVLYGYTNSAELDDLITLTKKIAAGRGITNGAPPPVVSEKLQEPLILMPAKYGLDNNVAADEKIEYLKKLDRYARREGGNKVSQVRSQCKQRRQQVAIFNSEGLAVSEVRHYSSVLLNVITSDDGGQASGYTTRGAMRGWEYIREQEPQQMAIICARQSLTKLKAAPCPAGEMPVIIDNAFGGVIFHEACGHALETTSVEKGASVFCGKKGQQIANPVVSAVDDGTTEGDWGSLAIDDEGMAAQHTQLIKDGILTSYLVDRVGSIKTGEARTGSGRRQSYSYAPASRMRNTYIEPGKQTKEELIASVNRGLYAKVMGGGSVSPATGEFNFAVQEGYLIENGKIGRPVKAASLIGRGDQILHNISMVADNLAIKDGMCGSVSGAIPTTVGQPAIKVDKILVGGEG